MSMTALNSGCVRFGPKRRVKERSAAAGAALRTKMGAVVWWRWRRRSRDEHKQAQRRRGRTSEKCVVSLRTAGGVAQILVTILNSHYSAKKKKE